MSNYENFQQSGQGDVTPRTIDFYTGNLDKREQAIREELYKPRNLNELYLLLLLLAKQTSEITIDPQKATIREMIATGNFFVKEAAKIALIIDSMTPGSNAEHKTRLLLQKAELGDFSEEYGIKERVHELMPVVQ